MDTYSSSNASSTFGPEPEDQTFDQEAMASFEEVFGKDFANEKFQIPEELQPADGFGESDYQIASPEFGNAQNIVAEPQEVVTIADMAGPQAHPDGYLYEYNLWYDIAQDAAAGAHFKRQIRWHYPRPAPVSVPQWPAARIARAVVAEDPDGYNPTLKIWYNMAVAETPGADFFREIGWHTRVPAPGGAGQADSTSLVAPFRPQIPVYHPAPYLAAPQPAPARRPVAKGRNPKKSSIIQVCTCKPQYSTIDVPRPPNQFLCYRNQESMKLQRESVRRGGTKVRHDQISKIVADKWNVMSIEERAPYKAQADRLAAEHRMKYPGYIFKPGMKAAHQFGSMSCTCGAYKINMAAREKRLALQEDEPPMPKKRGRGPGRKFADAEPETLPAYSPYVSTAASTTRKRKQRDDFEDEQPTPKRSTRTKTPVIYNEEDDSLFINQDEDMTELEGEYEEAAPVLALPTPASKNRRSPPAPIMTAPIVSPPLTRSAAKEPTPIKSADYEALLDMSLIDYGMPFEVPTSARSSKKSSGKGSVAPPVTPRRSTRLSSKEAL